MKQEIKDTSTHKDELSGNICKHCGEPYTTKERNRVYGNNVLMSGYCSAGCYTEGTLNPVAPVKDELDITKGEWVVLSEDFGRARIGVKISDTAERNICNTFQLGYGVSEPDNAKAICTAVNSTYGKGLNPAAMEELYKALELFTELHETGNWPGTDDLLTAKTALNNAKTK